MKYKGIEILKIFPIVYLGDEFKNKSFKYNEEYFKEKTKNLNFKYKFSYECPIENIIFIGFDYEDNYNPIIKPGSVERIITTISELSKVFEMVKVNLYLDGYIEEIANCVDMNLDEFLQYLFVHIAKLNFKN